MSKPWHNAAMAFACLTVVILATAPASADQGRCLIAVDGRSYLNGRCNIAIRPGGSFTVGVGDKSRSRYFAYVDVGDDSNRARGTWNGVDASGQAGTELGELRRKGACWSNSRARICAWKDQARRRDTP